MLYQIRHCNTILSLPYLISSRLALSHAHPSNSNRDPKPIVNVMSKIIDGAISVQLDLI